MLFGKLKCTYYILKANRAYTADNAEGTIKWMQMAYNTGAAKSNTVTTYGYLLLKNGRLEEAMKVFEDQLNSSKTTNNELYNIKSNYALGLWKQGKLDEAIETFENIIPNYKTTNVYGSLGYLYNLKGDLEKALAFNLEALNYNSTGTVILDNLGQTYYLMGEQEKALEIFNKLMALNPKFPEAFYDYSLILEKLGDREKSIEMLRNAQNYKINYLSAVTKEDIDSKLAELEAQQ
ncbi:tetratricopeptide repeat protein [Ruminiclostridium cellobioparum]|uniref:tetratricopeptide repeat protein n=1 Tax=Ruminiclostridium cellobioparum TaxID=29355 RepID=UPI00047F52C0|nr:tetratricopeptide repeat protein [Ruminiclostridium cellobioparum]